MEVSKRFDYHKRIETYYNTPYYQVDSVRCRGKEDALRANWPSEGWPDTCQHMGCIQLELIEVLLNKWSKS